MFKSGRSMWHAYGLSKSMMEDKFKYTTFLAVSWLSLGWMHNLTDSGSRKPLGMLLRTACFPSRSASAYSHCHVTVL